MSNTLWMINKGEFTFYLYPAGEVVAKYEEALPPNGDEPYMLPDGQDCYCMESLGHCLMGMCT